MRNACHRPKCHFAEKNPRAEFFILEATEHCTCLLLSGAERLVPQHPAQMPAEEGAESLPQSKCLSPTAALPAGNIQPVLMAVFHYQAAIHLSLLASLNAFRE